MSRRAPLFLSLIVVGVAVWLVVPLMIDFLYTGSSIGLDADPDLERDAAARNTATPVTVAEPKSPPNEPVTRVEEPAPGPSADPDATWIVRGRTLRGFRENYPGRRVHVTLHEGYDADGDAQMEAELISGEDGWFEWPLRPPSTTVFVSVRGLEEGHRNSSDSARVVTGGDPPQNLEVRMYPQDCVVDGHVRDEKGAPIAAARVWTSGDETTSGDDGAFTLKVSSVREEAYVYADAAGYAQERIIAKTAGPGSTAAAEFELVRAFQVTGRAVDEHGHPVAEVAVQTFFTRENVARTGADGRFVLDHLDPRRSNHMVYARKEGYVEANVRVEPEGDSIEVPDLVMKLGVQVQGFVYAADGAPLAGAELYIGFSPSAYNRLDAVAGDDGAFVFEHVPTGDQTLFASHPGYAPYQQVLSLAESEPVHAGLVIRLTKGHFIGGVVRDEEGEALKDVWVVARQSREYIPGRSVSDEEGRFRLDGLPGKDVDLEFFGTGIVRQNVPVTEFDREDLEVVIQRSAKVAGRVLDGITGEPLGEFLIRFVRSDSPEGRSFGYSATWSREGHRFTGTDGYWDSGDENLPPGGVLGIEARAEGYAPARDGEVIASVEPDPEECVLRLYPGATLTGRVEDSAGRPIAQAKLGVRAAADPSRYFSDEPHEAGVTFTDDDGRFTLDAVTPGESILMVQATDRPMFVDGPFEVPSHGRLDRVITLPDGVELRGTLQQADGRPWPAERISIYGLELPEDMRFSKDVVTDDEGRFQAIGLPDGLYQLSHSRREGEVSVQLLTRFVRVAGGHVDPVVMRAEGPCRLTGTLVLEDGTPYVAPIGVSLYSGLNSKLPRDQQPDGRGAVARDGTFEIPNVMEGKYTLMVHRWGRAQQLTGSLELTLEPGVRDVEVTLVESKRR